MSTPFSDHPPDEIPVVLPAQAPWQSRSQMSFVLELVRPYRGWLVIVFAAMMVEIAMSLAAPWPLKLVLDRARTPPAA